MMKMTGTLVNGRKTMGRLLSFLLTTAVGISFLLPMMPAWVVRAGYTDSPTSLDQLEPEVTDGKVSKLHEVTFGKDDSGNAQGWYVIGCNGTGIASTSGTVTLLTKDVIGISPYTAITGNMTPYSKSSVHANLIAYVTSSTHFTNEEQNAIVVRTLEGGPLKTGWSETPDYVAGDPVEAKLWLLSKYEAAQLPTSMLQSKNAWLRSPGPLDNSIGLIYNGNLQQLYVKTDGEYKKRELWPALQLDMSYVTYDSSSAAISYNPNAAISSYELEIPSTLEMTKSGWNAAGEIKAKGKLVSGKKLNIQATSDSEFNLVSGTNKIAYKVANTAPADGTAFANVTAVTSWDFTSLDESTQTTQAIGIVVDDFTDKPVGTYEGNVTFTASIVAVN